MFDFSRRENEHGFQFFDQVHIKASFSPSGHALYVGVGSETDGEELKLFDGDSHWWQSVWGSFLYKNSKKCIDRDNNGGGVKAQIWLWISGSGNQYFERLNTDKYSYNVYHALDAMKPQHNFWNLTPRDPQNAHIKLSSNAELCLTAGRDDDHNNKLTMTECAVDSYQRFSVGHDSRHFYIKSKGNGKCFTAPSNGEGDLTLTECQSSDQNQGFYYDAESKIIHLATSNVHCLNMWDGVGPLKSVVCSPHENNVKFEIANVTDIQESRGDQGIQKKLRKTTSNLANLALNVLNAFLENFDETPAPMGKTSDAEKSASESGEKTKKFMSKVSQIMNVIRT